MEQFAKDKILSLSKLADKLRTLKQSGYIVVQSHGVFDLVHPGIIKHLNDAKSQGDILVVTVIADKDVRRGPGRPVFPDKLRVENIASLEQVDFACIVSDETPFECVNRIKPDVFAKGESRLERDKNIHKKIFHEERELYFGKSRLYETSGFSFSSSQIINNFLDIYPDDTRLFLREFSKCYPFKNIAKKVDELKNLDVLLIGDGIIDEYHYCHAMGKSAKAHMIVNRYLTHEVFAGGVFAIANHVASLCNSVTLITLLGRDDTREEFILNNLKPNIQTHIFYREGSPTIVKRRYINQYLNQKLFEINYLNDNFIDGACESDIINCLLSELPKYDAVLVSDFGHGLITSRIIKVIETLSRQFSVNTQTNGANVGFNMITRYNNPHYVCLDEPEARMAVQQRFSDIEEISRNIARSINSDYFIVTLGKNGSIGINRDSVVNRTPIFSSRVVDTVGAGDAFFAYTAPCFAVGLPLDLVSFIGNAVGALAVQIVGNKQSVEKYELLEFIHTIMK